MPRYPHARSLTDSDRTKSDLIYENIMLKLELRQTKLELDEIRNTAGEMDLFFFTVAKRRNERADKTGTCKNTH